MQVGDGFSLSSDEARFACQCLLITLVLEAVYCYLLNRHSQNVAHPSCTRIDKANDLQENNAEAPAVAL